METPFAAAMWLLAVVMLILAVRRTRRRRSHGGVGTAAVGSVYDMLSEERRNAVELLLEGRAEARDPEDTDGDLPQLQDPTRKR